MVQSIILLLFITAILLINSFVTNVEPIHGKGIFNKQHTEIYRGVAVLMIVVAHCAGNLGTNIFTPFGGIGVSIFLLLSGYGLNESYKLKGLGGFIKKKLSKVWIPFVVFEIICYSLFEEFDYQKLIMNIFCIESNDYWFVYYLVRCYILFWVVTKFFSSCRWPFFVLFGLYSFFMMEGRVPEQCISFGLGVLFSTYKDKVESFGDKHLISLLFISGVIGISFLAIKQLSFIRANMDSWVFFIVETAIKMPLGLFVIIFFYMLSKRFFIPPLLFLLGSLSYEIYLVHMQMRSLIGEYAISAFAMLFVSVLLSYGLNKFNKLLRW